MKIKTIMTTFQDCVRKKLLGKAPEVKWVQVKALNPEDVGQTPEEFKNSLKELCSSGLVRIDSAGNTFVDSGLFDIPLDDPCWLPKIHEIKP